MYIMILVSLFEGNSKARLFETGLRLDLKAESNGSIHRFSNNIRQRIVPEGLRLLLQWLHKRYNDTIWITEIGCAGINESTSTRDEIIRDTLRQEFFTGHLKSMEDAITLDGIPLKAFLAWSLLDNWEWRFGSVPRFGVVGVDFQNGTLDRFIKDSARVMSNYFTSSSFWNVSNEPLKIQNNNNNASSDTTKQPKASNHSIGNHWSIFMILALCILWSL
jgi:beta-glucosidase/6-phospho-beta-glucosidase/beta-galactosidase